MNKLICVEGVDGSGKATQCRLMQEYTRGKIFSFPRYNTAIGKEIRAILSIPVEEREIQQKIILHELFYFDMKNAQDAITTALKFGDVILDRYYLSNLVYLDFPSEVLVKKLTTKLRKPTITFILDVDPKISMERKSKQREMDENEKSLKMQVEAREKYKKFAEGKKNVKIIKGDRNILEVRNDIMSRIKL